MDTETWLPVPGYEGKYEVSDLGRVRSLPRRWAGGRVLKPMAARYMHVRLYGPGNGSWQDAKVHLLVLTAFVSACPPGCEARHLDDDSHNNVLSNLRWGTHSENIQDQLRAGTHGMARKTHCPADHEYTEANTDPGSQAGGKYRHRRCRKCHAARERRRRRAHK